VDSVQVFETPGDVSLQVRLPSGQVVVSAVAEPRTTVEIVPLGRAGADAIDAIEVRSETRGDGHLITIEQKERIRWGPLQITWGADVEVRVTCPPGSNLDLSGGSTDLRVDGDLRDAAIKTASGDVRLGDVARRFDVKTASGDVRAGTIASGGQVVTVSGDLEVARFASELVARSVSGDVCIGAVQGPLELSTTSGDVSLNTVDAGEVRVQTVSGDVHIGVGHGTLVFIDATSVSGDLGSDLGVENELSEEADTAGGPVVPLRVKTVSGDVQIVRSAGAFLT
jgi:Putative adhesin